LSKLPGSRSASEAVKDPEATAHTGEIIAFLDYASVEAWKNQPWHNRGEEYDRLKHRVAEGLLDFVDRHYPGFKALVEYYEVLTPLTVEHFTGHLRGSVYGIPGTPERFRLPWTRQPRARRCALLCATAAD
jgi:all-trans-retinol 13,14-reductase